MSLWETIQWYWGNILDYGLQMLPCMLIGVFGFLLFLPSRKRRLASLGLSSSSGREAVLLLFVMFCAGLASVTLFPANFWSLNRWYWVLHGTEPLFPPVDWQIQWDTLQLTPFQEIIRAFRGPWVMFLMVANIGIFCPIGFFPALLWRGWRWWKSALLGLCTSVFIEFVQFFIGRSSDVDDVILNTAGTLVGFWIFWLINALLPQLTIKFQCTTKELPGYG